MNKIKETLKNLWARLRLAKQAAFLASASLILSLGLTGCKATRAKIDAAIWLNNAPIPPEVCASEPALYQYGFYRRLNNGKFEFISFCSPEANKWLAMYDQDFNKLMDEAGLPSKKR